MTLWQKAETGGPYRAPVSFCRVPHCIDTGFTAGSEDLDYDFDAQGCAFTVASEILDTNNYTDEFGGDGATMTFVAQQLLEQYPGIEIEARIFLDTKWSNTLEIVKTEDGEAVTEIEEL